MKSSLLAIPFYIVSFCCFAVLGMCETPDMVRAGQLPEMRQVIGLGIVGFACALMGMAINRAQNVKAKKTWLLGRRFGRNY